jgi:glycosyltransferase involved in cell wall biosynthesis
MSSVRLLIVGERFWPLVDGQALAMEQLGTAFGELGMRVTFLTRRWDKAWPDGFQFGAATVHYVAIGAKSIFSGPRSARNLLSALESYRDRVDAMILCGTGDFLHIPLRWARQCGVPCLVWLVNLGGDDLEGALQELAESPPPAHEWLRVVCEQSEAMARLAELDLPPSMAELVPPAILLNPPVDLVARPQLQAAFASVDPRLRLEPSQKIALAIGPIQRREAWLRLINAWPHVLARMPQARLWLMGSGEGFANLWEHARRNHNTDTIDFLGWFDDLDEFFGAADVFVVPDQPALANRWCLRAMWLGAPVLASEDPGVDAAGRRVAARLHGTTAAEWGADLLEALANGRQPMRLEAARDYVGRHRDLAMVATRWERWLRDAIGAKSQVGR